MSTAYYISAPNIEIFLDVNVRFRSNPPETEMPVRLFRYQTLLYRKTLLYLYHPAACILRLSHRRKHFGSLLTPRLTLQNKQPPNPKMSTSDPGFIAALEEARLSASQGGVPFGACLVSSSGEILGRGHNMRVQKGSATLHVRSPFPSTSSFLFFFCISLFTTLYFF